MIFIVDTPACVIYNVYAVKWKKHGVYRINPRFYEKSEPPGCVEQEKRGGNH